METKKNFDLIKDTIANNLLARAIGDKQKINCGFLLQQELPEFLKKYIEGHSLKLVRHEKPIRYSLTEHFDFKDQKVQDSFETLFNALVGSTVFTKKEVQSLFSTSINLHLDLLLQPRQTLESVFYQKAEQISKSRLLQSLEILGSRWLYLSQLIQEVSAHEDEEISKLGFGFLTKRVNEELYLNSKYKNLLDDFRLLNDLVRLAGPPHNCGLQTQLVLKFLGARDQEKLRETIANDDAYCYKNWSFDDFHRWLAAWDRTIDFSALATEEIDIIAATEPECSEITDREEPKIVFPDDEAGNFSVHKTEIEKQPPGPYPTMDQIIDGKDQKFLLRKVFKNDFAAYSDFFGKINATERWKDAKCLIDELVIHRSLDPYSKEAMKLGDLVFSRYFSK